MDVYQRMKELDIRLPQPPARGGLYTQAKRFGKGLIYISGCGPVIDGQRPQGKLGKDFTAQQGAAFARDCMLNVLAVLEAEIGSLSRVKNLVKLLTMVASADDFFEQPQVANGGSQLLVDLFGPELSPPARSAIGVNVLPGNIPVETEALFEVEEG